MWTALDMPRQETEPGELIDSGVLEQTQFGGSRATAGDHFHIYLDALARIGHLLIEVGGTSFFVFRGNIPSLRMTRNRLSRQWLYPRFFRRHHSFTSPRLGLQRRISWISFTSAHVYCLG